MLLCDKCGKPSALYAMHIGPNGQDNLCVRCHGLSARKPGRPRSNTKPVLLRLPADSVAMYREEATRADMSLSKWIQFVIDHCPSAFFPPRIMWVVLIALAACSAPVEQLPGQAQASAIVLKVVQARALPIVDWVPEGVHENYDDGVLTAVYRGKFSTSNLAWGIVAHRIWEAHGGRWNVCSSCALAEEDNLAVDLANEALRARGF